MTVWLIPSPSCDNISAAAAPVAKAAEKPVEEEVDALDGGTIY